MISGWTWKKGAWKMSKKQNVTQKVDKLINNLTVGTKYPRRIYLHQEEWQEFYKIVEPMHITVHGIPLVDLEATKEGFDNILYRGVAICMQ